MNDRFARLRNIFPGLGSKNNGNDVERLREAVEKGERTKAFIASDHYSHFFSPLITEWHVKHNGLLQLGNVPNTPDDRVRGRIDTCLYIKGQFEEYIRAGEQAAEQLRKLTNKEN